MTPTSSTLSEPTKTTVPVIPAHLKRLVLTGFMGAGKSTTGRLLASRLSWNFLDLDTHLESRTGTTIPQLFRDHGEARFRRLESTALASDREDRARIERRGECVLASGRDRPAGCAVMAPRRASTSFPRWTRWASRPLPAA